MDQKDYHKTLDNAVLNKRQQQFLDQQKKEHERDFMNENVKHMQN